MKKQRLIEDIESAMDWLLPGRPVGAVEIENCIGELQDIVNDIKGEIAKTKLKNTYIIPRKSEGLSCRTCGTKCDKTIAFYCKSDHNFEWTPKRRKKK